MKTLSTIVLEEAIKTSLIEQGLTLDPTKKVTGGETQTIKPQPKPGIQTDQLVYDIALEIINSAGINDDEDRLINAIKQIPNSTVFYKVNDLIKQNKHQTFSQFLSNEILNDDEWEVWIPILEHLIKILPSEKDSQVFQNIMSKTAGLAQLRSKNKILADKIAPKLGGSVTKDEENEYNIDFSNPYMYVFYGLLTIYVCRKLNICKLKSLFSRSAEAKRGASQLPADVIQSTKLIKRIIGTPGFWNKKRLTQVVLYELKKGRITRDEANKMLLVLKQLDKQDINRYKFDHILKIWQQDLKRVKAGQAKDIINAVDDYYFTRDFGPKLQAIEDRLLSKQQNKTTKKPKKPKIDKKKDYQKTDIGFRR